MKNNKSYRLVIQSVATMALLLFLLLGCTGPSPCPTLKKNQVSYGWQGENFMGEWDDYYACALSYIDGEFYVKALECLDQAVKQRASDQRMARTYGMHFIHDYFPNRETGIIHFLMGKYGIAEKNLLLSLEQEPSAKAYYYLDEVRRALMEKKQPADSRPDISITLPPGGTNKDGFHTTSQLPVLMTGTVSDSRYVSWITINNKSVFMEGSREKMHFNQPLYLNEGAHTIEISAGNLMDKTSRKRIKIFVDKSGPLISITRIKPGKDIFGYLNDKSGIARLTLNGREIVVSSRDGGFYAPLYPGEHSITLQAEDTLGNITEKQMNSPNPKVKLAALNLSGIIDFSADLCSQNRDQPEIRLSKPHSNEIFTTSTTLEFTVASPTPILALALNGKSLLEKPGLWITCSIFAPLEQGLNRFTITAVTQTGRTVEKTVVLNKRTPEHLKLSYRYGISLYPFDNNEQVGNWKNFVHNFEKKFCANRRFRLISKGLNKTIAESGAAPYTSALFGSVYKSGNGTEVVARLVDKKTSKIITVQDAFSSVSDMAYLGNRLSTKFHQKFPLATGTITTTGGFFASSGFKVSMDENVCQKNPETQIESDWPFLVYRKKHDGSTQVIAADCIKGKCGKLFKKGNKPGIGDKVITQ